MNALQISGVSSAAVSVVPSAIEERQRMIDRLEAIEVICDHRSNENAVEILREAMAIIKGVDKTRVFLAGPLLALLRQLNSAAEDFCLPLQAALSRVQAMLSEFAANERRRAEEAAAKQREELRKIEVQRQKALEAEAERERQERRAIEIKRIEAMKAAKDEEERRLAAKAAEEQKEALRNDARGQMSRIEDQVTNARIGVLSTVPVQVVRATGQVTRPVWVFDVVDLQALLKARPDLVTIEPSRSAINAAIKLGMRECPGLVIRQEVRAGVRT